MNIFLLDKDPIVCAQYHCNTHTVKMILESAQMLSTAHRVLDGKMTIHPVETKTGKIRNKKIWTHPSKILDNTLYKVAHLNHPSTVWTRRSAECYLWHYSLFVSLCDEYSLRYEKVHKTDTLLREILKHPPENIESYEEDIFTNFPLAMKSEPQCMDQSDPVKSYREFYKTKTKRMKMVWKKRDIPEWFR